MQYFNSISDLEQAKQQYRILAKQLHPDKGGSATEFQKMQEEYKELLLKLQKQYNHAVITNQSPENELLSELGKLAKVLIKKQVPQNYLKKKMQNAQSPLKKGLFIELVNFLDKI